jgi:hypothetical protein
VSVAIASNLDKMQREYLSGGLINKSNSMLLARPEPMSRITIAQSMKNSNLDPVIRSNWVDRDNNI